MLLVFRALLVLVVATLLHAAKKDPARLNGKAVRLVLDPSLQLEISRTSTSSIANMSLSPWTYRDSLEESRLPQRIAHAQCLTSGCLSLQGGGEDEALEAKPIYYQVLVLHRQRHGRKRKTGRKRRRHQFRLETELVPVGCTCVRPSVKSQQ